MHVFGLSHTGVVRTQNQDSISFEDDKIGPLPNLFVVADGMGGHNAGEVASKEAIDVFSKYIEHYPLADLVQPGDYSDLLVSAAQEANKAVYNKSSESEEMAGMGTTFTACAIENGRVSIIHVGDSRIYAIEPDKISQLTTDHTYVTQMVKLGKMTIEEARTHPKRNVITNALGTDISLVIDSLQPELFGTTTLLMCSDGLTDMIDDNGILEIVNRQGYVEDRVKALVDEANHRGGVDNISVILIDIGR